MRPLDRRKPDGVDDVASLAPPLRRGPATQWLLDLYAECERGSRARWSGPGISWLDELNSCPAWHVDIALATLLVVILALLAARRLGWIGLHPREIVFFALCLGLAPLYVWAWWAPGLAVGGIIVGLVAFAFPVAALFVIGLVRLFRRRADSPLPAVAMVGVIVIALLGHGCVHLVSYWGIGS